GRLCDPWLAPDRSGIRHVGHGPGEHVAPDHLGHGSGRPDPHRRARHLDRHRADHLQLPLAALRQRRRQLRVDRCHHRDLRADRNPGSNDITITIHLKTTSAPASPDWDLSRKGLYTTSGGEFKMEYQPSGQASCGFKGSSGYSELIAGPSLKDGRWHTVQCVKTSSAIKVVVDGQTFTQAANVGSIANSEAVVIGARPGSEFFQGSLDEASIKIG